jgi:geranylgeranyl pyrophosphate synthase
VELPEQFKSHLDNVHQSLLNSVVPTLPSSLREPIHYFLKMPGKKIRPLLTLFSCQAVGGNIEDALPAATAVELFHDFTLIHDDIMDQDELRRGFQTMHVKYGDSTAILVGDALIGLAYQELIKSPSRYFDVVVKIFTEALVKVCEGQALDKEFESRREVTLEEYLDMIGKKTAWLIKVACALGALCGGGGEEQVALLTRFGYSLGLGFQIQDDLLDFVADESKLGKKVGSDFKMHKKTYVNLKYQEILQQNRDLQKHYPLKVADFSSFPEFQKALREINVVKEVKREADFYIEDALTALQKILPLDENNPLYLITHFLQNRQY